MSRVTWISPDECDLRVWAWAGVPHHALDVEAGGGPGHGDVQPLHVSRVTSQLARGATCHLVAHHARVAQTVDVGGVGGQLQLLQPGHVSRHVSRHVSCHVLHVTCNYTVSHLHVSPYKLCDGGREAEAVQECLPHLVVVHCNITGCSILYTPQPQLSTHLCPG